MSTSSCRARLDVRVDDVLFDDTDLFEPTLLVTDSSHACTVIDVGGRVASMGALTLGLAHPENHCFFPCTCLGCIDCCNETTLPLLRLFGLGSDRNCSRPSSLSDTTLSSNPSDEVVDDSHDILSSCLISRAILFD